MQLQDLISQAREVRDNFVKTDFFQSMAKEYQTGDEESRAAMFLAREKQGKSPESTMLRQMFQSYRTPQALNAVTDERFSVVPIKQREAFKEARRMKNIEFDVDNFQKKAGTAIGALGSDITQDSARRV